MLSSGEIAKMRMKQLGLTEKKLEEMTGLSSIVVHYFLSGERQSINTALKLQEAMNMGTTLIDLLEMEGKKTKGRNRKKSTSSESDS